ncbi:hypothetical protein ACEUZ9_002900 [Paracoccus litorisediminis]|uniref:hypothetical protein n=1 Tax=Paracoccus litorisediminis TaxID=2006130 RepID=UPI00372F9F98
MSTGLECEFIEVQGLHNGFPLHFMIMQSRNCPVGAWDWREHDPVVTGPFRSQREAELYLERRFANPGGFGDSSVSIEELLTDKVLHGLIEKQLGRAIDRPLPPDQTTDVTHRVMRNGGFIVGKYPLEHHWSIKSGAAGEPWRAEVRRSWAKSDPVLLAGSLAILRDRSGIRVELAPEPNGDAKLLDQAEDMLKSMIGRLYPDEGVSIGLAHPLRSEPDDGPGI